MGNFIVKWHMNGIEVTEGQEVGKAHGRHWQFLSCTHPRKINVYRWKDDAESKEYGEYYPSVFNVSIHGTGEHADYGTDYVWNKSPHDHRFMAAAEATWRVYYEQYALTSIPGLAYGAGYDAMRNALLTVLTALTNGDREWAIQTLDVLIDCNESVAYCLRIAYDRVMWQTKCEIAEDDE